ncbi:MAG TPA: hypothetical protein VGP72_22155 [Planctomycetota bacterium]|jgi:hypothetical protein
MTTTRRGFLAFLPALPFLNSRVSAQNAPAREFHLDRFFVAGFQNDADPALVEELAPRALLTLRAEEHSAVRIMLFGRTLGYVPRARNHHIFALLEQRAPLTCRVVRADPRAPSWATLEVEVGIRMMNDNGMMNDE